MSDPVFVVRMRRLEYMVIGLTALCSILAIGLGIVLLRHTPQVVEAAQTSGVIRTKGLIIEDAQGRARILLGAPFPTISDRQRQDSTAVSLLFLDEQGHDRISVGEVMPAQTNGKVPPNFHRIGNAYALTIYDAVGNERGGMGFLTNGSTLNRAAVVLDRPGTDAIGMSVDDNSDTADLALMYSPKVSSYATGLILSTQGKKASIMIKDFRDVPRANFSIGPDSQLSFRTFDSTGKEGPEMLSGDAAHN